MTIMEAIMSELKELPAEKLNRAAVYIHKLREHRSDERIGVIRGTSGCLAGPVGASFANAIDAGCERIDASGW